ncbi:MAG: GIY-YIG nuclease family protein [Candidatus Abawacabacteria bacterium]|nr:GIY-YIG nuclease family protein [Candidatus Abawacabacteria bacterium]
MFFVYFLKSQQSDFLYIGSTGNLKRRLQQHTDGNVQSTKHYRPLGLVGYIVLPTEVQVHKLESYFKTGSGKAVLKKRILQY